MTESLHKHIAEAALVSCGKGIAWNALLRKKPLRIAYLGGSVTQGYSNGEIRRKEAFSALVDAALKAEGIVAEYVLCAEAGMDSLLCGVLAESEVIPFQPDLVFLEFAINDTTLRHNVFSFESLLCRMLTLPSHPAVCLLMMRSACDYSCESFMLPMAEHYALPCISMRRGLQDALASGALKWEEFADSESHPTAEGHRLLADCVLHLLHTAADQPEEPPRGALPEPWLGTPFLHLMRLLPALCDAVETAAPVVETGEWYFRQAWELSEGCGMKLMLRCSAAVVVFETHRLPEYGSCRVLTDGVPLREPLRSNSIYGWGNPRHMIVLQAETAGLHTIELEPFDGIFRVLTVAYAEG